MNEWVGGPCPVLLLLLFRILNNKERKENNNLPTTTCTGQAQNGNKQKENPFASAIAAYMSYYTEWDTHTQTHTWHYEEGGQRGGRGPLRADDDTRIRRKEDNFPLCFLWHLLLLLFNLQLLSLSIGLHLEIEELFFFSFLSFSLLSPHTCRPNR